MFAVLDVAGVALIPVDFFAFLDVENGGDVRFDRDPAVVAAVVCVGQDVFDAAKAFTRHVVNGFDAVGDGVLAILHVNVNDMVANFLPELERILPRESAIIVGLGTVALEDRVPSIEDELESRNFLNETKGVVG